MRPGGAALRLTVFLGESDQWHHRPAYTEVVHRAHAAGLAGATVLRGVEGFGASSRVHTSRLLSLGEELPVVVVVVDDADKVEAFLPRLGEVVAGGLVTLEPVTVVRCAGGSGSGAPAAGASPEGTPG